MCSHALRLGEPRSVSLSMGHGSFRSVACGLLLLHSALDGGGWTGEKFYHHAIWRDLPRFAEIWQDAHLAKSRLHLGKSRVYLAKSRIHYGPTMLSSCRHGLQ